MKYVYHGSKVHGLKTISPHRSTHGTYVYAMEAKEIAIIMSKRCGDDATFSLSRNDNKEKYNLVERIPHAFEKMFSNEFSLYTLDGSHFKDIKTGFNEVVSEEEVPVIKEEIYPSLIEAVKTLVDDGLINIYYYPDRPNYIPEDDSSRPKKRIQIASYILTVPKRCTNYIRIKKSD